MTLPGEISSADFGVKEYWSDGKNNYFIKPSDNIIEVEGEVNYELVKNFSSEDNRKIFKAGSSSYVVYSKYDKEYLYENASFYQDYKLVNKEIDVENGNKSKCLYSIDINKPYYYIDTLAVSRFIKDEDSFNEVCFSYDHDTLGYYMLTKDIDFVSSKRNKIATSQDTYSFLGTLDGNNHRINEIYINNNLLGIFGGNLHKKEINGVTYSPIIKRLTIEKVSGNNRLFGDQISDVEISDCGIYQGKYNQEINYEGLLAREVGNNVKIISSTFSLSDLVNNPCLFINQKEKDVYYSSSRIIFSLEDSYLIKNNKSTIANSKISGVTWLSDGAFSLKTYNGASINVIGNEVETYLNLKDDKSTTNDEIAEFLYTAQTHNSYSPIPITINYSASSKVVGPISLIIAKDRQMTDIYKTYTDVSKSGSTYKLYNLIPNTYYYQLVDNGNLENKSIVDSFTISNPLRLINADGVANMRDLGGWINKNGKQVKYELIYRSANWSGLSTKGEKAIKDELGIKTEIDVRFSTSSKDYSKSEHPISGVNFIQNGLTDYYGGMLSDSNTITDIKRLFNILTDSNNYPISYHCTQGADRTGFCSLIIESVLGLTNEDIYRDYELTTFYYCNRVRADILKKDNGDYYFKEDGGRKDFYNQTGFKMTLEKDLKPYYTSSNLICDAMTNFLKTKCSITDNQIEAVRDILLNK